LLDPIARIPPVTKNHCSADEYKTEYTETYPENRDEKICTACHCCLPVTDDDRVTKAPNARTEGTQVATNKPVSWSTRKKTIIDKMREMNAAVSQRTMGQFKVLLREYSITFLQ
jgi:hypothetical protein